MIRHAAVTLVLAALGQTAPPPAQVPQPVGDGLIAGRVIDGVTGRPVTGVAVTLVTRQGAAGGGGGAPSGPVPIRPEPTGLPGPNRVLVDSSGRFVFAALSAGGYELTATKRGYVPGMFGKLRVDGAGSGFILAEHERRTDVTIRVWKFSSIAGSVLDEAGEPVVGVNVVALRREWSGGEPRLTQNNTATTDDRGAFRIGSLVAGDYAIVVPSLVSTLPLAAVAASRATDAPPEIAYAVSQTAGLTMGPLVLGGRDVKRVGDFAVSSGLRSVVMPEPSADGRLTVYQTAVVPEVAGPVSSTSLIALAAGEARSIPPIQLRPVTAVRVSGVVTGTSSGSATALVLIPQSVDGFSTEYGFESARAMAGAQGAFTFLGVTPGTYRLRAYTATNPYAEPKSQGGSLPATHWLNDVIVVGTTDVTLSLAMRPALSIRGQLVFEGQKPRPEQSGVQVVGVSPADGRSLNTLTGRYPALGIGEFGITEIAGGRYVLRVSPPSGWFLKSITLRGQDAIDVPFDLSDDIRDVVVTFGDRPTSITGTVHTAAGAIDEEATVIVFPTDQRRWNLAGRTPIRLRSVRARTNGAFTFSGLPPGDYFVAAIYDGAASALPNAKFLEALARVATRVQLGEGTALTQDLRRVEVK